MPFDLQPHHLENDLVQLVPLHAGHFETLYAVANDPLIWEQHPNRDRYKREVFEKFFEGALASGGAFIIFDAQSGQAIGSSRFYDFDEANSEVKIGYTFYARSHWGGGYNPAAKALMLKHAFQFVDTVIFLIGEQKLRSQIAITRLGAEKIGEEMVEYYGETPKLNFVYAIRKTI
jgi:RimJ/RimL family protein N-acetyltransferase